MVEEINEKYSLKNVTQDPLLWLKSDPVRPELGVEFKTSPGRGVFGLRGEDGGWKAFLCYARTSKVPSNVKELEDFTDVKGEIIIPYTVWSHEKGAGRQIIKQVLWLVENAEMGIKRVVTLSPPTEMARKFHLRNSAFELRVNPQTVNFEYAVEELKELAI
tara:strand:+ start:1651 stop:2133 length:483 start_codon:yes stop_codon:yes gene_type:complete